MNRHDDVQVSPLLRYLNYRFTHNLHIGHSKSQPVALPSVRMSETTGQCTHITVTLAEGNADNSTVAKYKSVVAWNVNRYQSVKNPAKRRKVSPTSWKPNAT